MLQTAFTRLFDMRHPIMQAPMGGGISTPELAAAVSNAGGLGMLAVGGLPPEAIRAQIRRTHQLTDHPFGVNLLLPMYLPGQAEVCIEERVAVLSLFWGDPAPHVNAAHAGRLKVMVQVGSVDEAKAARDAGVDVIVAQGVEAGGHVRGTISALVLVPLVVQAVRPLPVVAAGGIANGRGVAAMLMLGAAGAALGTRFLASEESAAHPDYKERILRARADDTLHTTLFDIGWPDAPHRVLRNSVVTDWEAAGCPPPGQRPHEGESIGQGQFGDMTFPVSRYTAMPPSVRFEGEVEKTALYAGESCGLIDDLRPAGAIVKDLARDAEAVIRNLPKELCA
jgi:NAD(P)H-dependent flavin oxidoreductase YrpB (nitropropane dioxygenase family)